METTENHPYRTVTTTQARSDFGELIERVHYTRDDVVVMRKNKPFVAIISFEDYVLFMKVIDRIEEAQDVEDIRKQDGEETISLDDVLAGFPTA